MLYSIEVMSLSIALNNLTDNISQLTPAMTASLDIGLLKAIQIRGSFPSSLNLIEQIKTLSSSESVSASDMLNLIRTDPVLTIRVLSLANHEVYSSEPVFNLRQAVSNIGVERLSETLPDLAAGKNFNAVYLSKSVAATMMQQTLIAGLFAEKLVSVLSDNKSLQEISWIVSLLINSGPLLLAYYKPNIYSAISLDCMDDRIKFEKEIPQVIQKNCSEFAAMLVRLLSIPEDFAVICDHVSHSLMDLDKDTIQENNNLKIAFSVYVANLLAHEICYFTGVQGIQSLIFEISNKGILSKRELENTITPVADSYIEYSKRLNLKPVRLPEYLTWFDTPSKKPDDPIRWQQALPPINERINPFLYELRSCFKNRTSEGEFYNLPQAIYCTLNALMKGLNFDRSIFFKIAERETHLEVALCMGVKLFKSSELKRFINDPDAEEMPDIKAFHGKKTFFEGVPVFKDGWPFMSFPAVWKGKVVGVFYADKIRRPDNDALDLQEQISCVALAEEWQDIPLDYY